VAQVSFESTDDEHCTAYEGITPLSSHDAAELTAWEGLADGSYSVQTRSVTWEETSTYVLTVAGGRGTTDYEYGHWLGAANGGAEDAASGEWVRYWLQGEDAPFAVCHDDPDVYDEEGCYVWSSQAG